MRFRGRISQLFCEHWGERTLSAAARKSLQAIIPSSSTSEIPVAIEAAAKYVGIEQVVEAELTNCDGSLSRTALGSYIATLRSGQGKARKRFTLAHEIGHAIVFRSIGHSSTQLGEGHLQCRTRTLDERDEEHVCDVLAAELLMPRMQFLRCMGENGVCASSISVISRKFGVSLQAGSRRVSQLLSYEVGIGQWATSQDGTAFVPEWYVTKHGAMAVDYVIQVGKPGSECFRDSAVRGWQWIPLHGHMEKYYVDIFPIRGTRRRWLAMIIFSDAAQQIMAGISKQRSGTASQLPLIDEQM